MSVEGRTTVSQDLAAIADRVAAEHLLRPEFCDRLTGALSQLWAIASAEIVDDDLGRLDSILLRLVPVTSRGTRIELSDRICDSAQPPRGVLLVLAHDEIAVAGPILRRSPALTEDDLIDVARRCGTSHMGAIADRPSIPFRVTDVLVLRGDDAVRRVVCRNAGALISDKSFARLSLQAREDEEIGVVLVARADLPDLVVRFLRDNGPADLRRRLAERHPAARPAETMVSIRATEEGWLEPYDFVEAAENLRRQSEPRPAIDAFVRKLAQRNRFAEVVLVLTEAGGLPLELVKRAMVSLDTAPFSKIARAVGLKPDTVQEILMIGPWLHRLDGRARDAAMLAYQTTTAEDARAALQRWAGEKRH